MQLLNVSSALPGSGEVNAIDDSLFHFSEKIANFEIKIESLRRNLRAADWFSRAECKSNEIINIISASKLIINQKMPIFNRLKPGIVPLSGLLELH
ncbi:hypothetical protein [Roseibium sp.]|uniref:hypothetical protein n=1 Tax=Roseibium sp. TaxID=1936156 RepID=UPI003A97372D